MSTDPPRKVNAGRGISMLPSTPPLAPGPSAALGPMAGPSAAFQHVGAGATLHAVTKPHGQYTAILGSQPHAAPAYCAPAATYAARPAYRAPAATYAAARPAYRAPAATYAARPAYQEPAYDEPANYAYNYGVSDDYSGANFNAEENRNDYATSGSYSVALPDGRTQTVNYRVDDAYSGYIADVQYSGYAAAPAYKAAPAYAAAPVYKAAPARYA